MWDFTHAPLEAELGLRYELDWMLPSACADALVERRADLGLVPIATLATGAVSSFDNQIDLTTGTFKLRAQFDNADGALFPNQFVNVKLLVDLRKDVVLAPTAAEADALSTAFYVLGPPAAMQYCRNHPAIAAILFAELPGNRWQLHHSGLDDEVAVLAGARIE